MRLSPRQLQPTLMAGYITNKQILKMNIVTRTCSVIVALLLLSSISIAGEKQILVQSTTSTANSGLYRYLLPLFTEQTGITVNVVAVGTGQAIRNARNCDADVLLVHAKDAEDEFVADGFGIERFNLMYNDFVIIGPSTDPANVSQQSNVHLALEQISTTNALFASRGDDSGTHKKEQSLWSAININVDDDKPSWYRSTGSGMGATINTAIGLGAYTISDRATWISFKNKSDFDIRFQGDPLLFNQYGVTLVNPERCPTVAYENAQQFVDWLLSKDTQESIAAYTVTGQQLFYPNAR